MPWTLPNAFRAMKSSRLSVHSLPSELTLIGRPFSKRIVTSWGVDGAAVGSLVLVTVSDQLHSASRIQMYLPSPHVVGGWLGGILELSTLVAAVSDIVIHAVRLRLGGSDRDAGLGCVVEQRLSTFEPFEELGHSPGSYDLDLGVDCEECQFETNLIVSFALTTEHPLATGRLTNGVLKVVDAYRLGITYSAPVADVLAFIMN